MSTDALPTVPKELSDLVNALKALSGTIKLLRDGMWHPGYDQLNDGCQQFIKSLHMSTLASAIQHPDARLVEELRCYLEGKEDNGQSTHEKSSDNNVDE